jgi:hypothetical protein
MCLPALWRKDHQHIALPGMELDSPYSGDELLFEIMHYDFFNIPPIEIAKASIAVSRKICNPPISA